MQNAVIATEDRSFWTNDGIDLGAVFRAFLTNVTSGKIEQGGSTITQQLVKNRILTSKRDVNRKIKEIEDALRLNEKFSKEKILVEYLNTVYFGSGSYGIKAAAARFFYTLRPGCPFGPRGKHLDELTIGEAALLAGRDLEPRGQQPVHLPRPRHPPSRRRAARHGRPRATSPRPRPTPPTTSRCRRCRRRPRPVVGTTSSPPRSAGQPAQRAAALGATEKERLDKVLKGGLKIYTTFDPNLQRDGDRRDHQRQAADTGADWASSLVSIDPATGAVKAMVSGQDFAVEPDQHRHLAVRPPDRFHVQGDHPRRRAR